MKKIVFAVVITLGASLALSVGYAGLLVGGNNGSGQVIAPATIISTSKVETISAPKPIEVIEVKTGSEQALELRLKRIEARLNALEAKQK